ncbi:MAG: porin [Rhodospirillaceae bacterium]|nr:MAG: porin [Rhodospirillaceae bacterium]
MKKFLYGTTALVAAGLMTSPLYAAEPLKLGISGNLQEWFGIVGHEKDTPVNGTKRGFNTFGINTDNEINFRAVSTLDNGIEVEAFLRLNMYDNNVGPDLVGVVPGVPTAGAGLDEQWVALGTAAGKVYAGAKDSINRSLHNEPVDYGIGYGDTWIWTTRPLTGLTSNLLGATPGNWTGAGGRARTSFEQMANQVPILGYISPKFAGLQLGLTYAPNSGALGTNNDTKGISPIGAFTGATDHWDVTLAYSREFAGVSIGLDGGFAHQDLRDAAARRLDGGENDDATAWNGGLKIGYAGFTLGASFMQTNRAGMHIDDGNAWNAGLGYANGPWGASYTYFQERRRGNHAVLVADANGALQPGDRNEKFATHVFSGKYTLGPGVHLKSSFFHGKYDGRNRSVDTANTWAYGLVSGLDVSF